MLSYDWAKLWVSTGGVVRGYRVELCGKKLCSERYYYFLVRTDVVELGYGNHCPLCISGSSLWHILIDGTIHCHWGDVLYLVLCVERSRMSLVREDSLMELYKDYKDLRPYGPVSVYLGARDIEYDPSNIDEMLYEFTSVVVGDTTLSEIKL